MDLPRCFRVKLIVASKATGIAGAAKVIGKSGKAIESSGEINEAAQQYIEKSVSALNEYAGKGVAGMYRLIDMFSKGSGDTRKIITEIKYKPSSGAILKANPNKTTTVLGSFEKDTKNIVNEMGNVKSTDFGARNGSFNVLNVPDDMYKDADQFWNEINKPWLGN